ncbi:MULTISPECIES: aspartate 1-decarboxylase (aspartate alpha-decarboxylase) [Anaerococcus]|uniref:Aspartate 1-decarboxylase (Aspartate alpha-decarboxylase) n=1 Tax=Anaerococcus octavius TaxID=54007 RepID=A0A2I1M8Q6_9FIRM|nr:MULTISPECIES: aspartate 1-decarboxylase (aspartate alpha-decarboxylase) [Anaerococcus]MDU5505086.1 aspartate 1-decarboxylase (aspartate alpha-decarboxylase) [Anaerococcus vaginalis]MBS6105920.1 aspartate 1-decarboxylase (aspartate alpha-decarboxylase) [Anaerococcus sp.]MDU0894830.1 aspartate 1-decarboxylase (aspartate alpha-decarboxylase) [Anaerococcus sp.]MDU2599280.1 aspartate 1-decarboxylase (aspartate alpha-decarboxylase) [Anaerococcus sp.]MDU4025855.1 aspartate 1-decarboxylase (asparta
MRDFKTGRKVDPKERVLVVKDKVYTDDSFVIFDTSKLEDYPPEVYYDREDIYLGKMFDEDVYVLPDIEEILLNYQDQCFSNHDLDDLREFLVSRRISFYEKLEQI